MMIAIHDRPGSYSDRWCSYCTEKEIAFRRVDCSRTDIIQQLDGARGLLWHWSHSDPGDVYAARRVLQAAEARGLHVFPDRSTCWHYDDKVGQKYLLEAVGAPLVPSYVFYDAASALAWIQSTTFPKVFKLGCGAGSENVKLVGAIHARALVARAFTLGFRSTPGLLRDSAFKARRHAERHDMGDVFRRLPATLKSVYHRKLFAPSERGYVYFQDFIPANRFDTRITIIGKRAFGFTRNVRPNDFRASGSGSIEYQSSRIDPETVQVAFDVAEKLGTQSLAFDFVRQPDGHVLIVEISYAYLASAVYGCPGFWDRELNWHPGSLWPQDAILDDFVTSISQD